MRQTSNSQKHVPDANTMVPDGIKELARHQPCGCITCHCENDTRCQGCGAKSCGTHDVGNMPDPVYITSDHITDAGKMIWQPIGTAPKPVQRGYQWLTDRVVVWDTCPFIARKNDETGWICEQTGLKLKPTHWMPLPKDPTTTE